LKATPEQANRLLAEVKQRAIEKKGLLEEEEFDELARRILADGGR